MHMRFSPRLEKVWLWKCVWSPSGRAFGAVLDTPLAELVSPTILEAGTALASGLVAAEI